MKKAQQAAENRRSGGPALIDNPAARVVAALATGGWSEVARTAVKTGQAVAKGDVVGVVKGLSGLDLPGE